jgi:hypothetical protein
MLNPYETPTRIRIFVNWDEKLQFHESTILNLESLIVVDSNFQKPLTWVLSLC